MVGASGVISGLGNIWSERLQSLTELEGGRVFEIDVVGM